MMHIIIMHHTKDEVCVSYDPNTLITAGLKLICKKTKYLTYLLYIGLRIRQLNDYLFMELFFLLTWNKILNTNYIIIINFNCFFIILSRYRIICHKTIISIILIDCAYFNVSFIIMLKINIIFSDIKCLKPYIFLNLFS